MFTNASETRSLIAVRRFCPSSSGDSDSSDSDVEMRGRLSGGVGGVSEATTTQAHLMDASEKALPLTVGVTTFPRARESSSSLELSTLSLQGSPHPARSALAPELGRPMPFAAAPKNLPGDETRSSDRGSSTPGNEFDVDNPQHGDGGTAQRRQRMENSASPLRVVSTSPTSHPKKKEAIQSSLGVSVPAAVATALSTVALDSPATHIDAVPSPSPVMDLLKRKKALPTPAIGDIALTTPLTYSSPEAAANASRPVICMNATDMPSAQASPLVSALAPLAQTSMGPAPTDLDLTVAAAAAPAHRSSLKEFPQESHWSSTGSLESPSRDSVAGLAAPSSPTPSSDVTDVMSNGQIASATSPQDTFRGVANAASSISRRTLNVPLTSSEMVNTRQISSLPSKSFSTTGGPHTAASATPATRHDDAGAAFSVASTSALAAMPDDGGSASNGGNPDPCDSGSVVYNRVSAHRLGTVLSRVFEAPSRSTRRALPTEHTSSCVAGAAATESPAIAEGAFHPPQESSEKPPVITKRLLAAGALEVEEPKGAFSISLTFGGLPTRPHRQAPRLPGPTHTAAFSPSLIVKETYPPGQLGTSPVTSVLPIGGNDLKAGQPDVVSVQESLKSPSLRTSPPSPPQASSTVCIPSAAASGGDVAPTFLSSSAIAAAAQRQREAVLIIYDDCVPPSRRRAKRGALPLTHQPGAGVLRSWMVTSLLGRLRREALQEGRDVADDVLGCRPVLRIGGGASWRADHVDCVRVGHPLGGESVGDFDPRGVLGEKGITAPADLNRRAVLHRSSGAPAGHGGESPRDAGEDRPVKVSRHRINNDTVQQIFSEMQRQQRWSLGADFCAPSTKHREAMSRVDVHALGQRSLTSRDVRAAREDVCIVSPSLADVSFPASTVISNVPQGVHEAVNVDLLNFPRLRTKQQQYRFR